MKNHKRMISIIIALAIVICMNTPAYALSKKTDVYEKITYHQAEDLEKVASNYGLMLKTKEKFVKGVTKEVYVYEKYKRIKRRIQCSYIERRLDLLMFVL